jgi:PIN domain nuclease of toxin-antitoxin system
MKLLLDTHIWIWALESPEKLSRAVRRQLAHPASEIYLSPISVWEAHRLAERGRLRTRAAFREWLKEVITRVPLREAPFNLAVAEEAAGIRLPQSDLGDVFLAATANVFGLTLVTADAQLIECAWLKTLANK